MNILFLSFPPAHVPQQPPDVTNNAKSTRQADRVGRYNQSSVRMNAQGNVTGLQEEDGWFYIFSCVDAFFYENILIIS